MDREGEIHPEAQPHGGDKSARLRRVLIVDDNPDLRFLTRLTLEGAHCEIVGEATNGEEALEAVADMRPDVVIMDMKMPIMDGIDATKEITSRFPDVEVIVISGSDDPALLRRIFNAGASASVDKANLDHLVAQINLGVR